MEKLVEIREQDFLTANLSPASVVTLYLSYGGNLAVRPPAAAAAQGRARGWFPLRLRYGRIGSRKLRKPIVIRLADQHPLHLWRIGEPVVFSDNSPEILHDRSRHASRR